MKKGFYLPILLFFCIQALAVDGDNTPPVLHWITITPDTVMNGDSITVTLKVSDSESELALISVSIMSPNHTQLTTINGNLEEEDPGDPYWIEIGDSTYAQKIKLNDYAIAGDWFVSSIWIYDDNYNYLSTSYTDSTLYEFYVNSVMGDDEPPQVTDLTFSTDTLNNGDTITVFLEANDAVSGLKVASINLAGPSGSQIETFSGSFYILETEDNIWDSLGSNLYSARIKITQFAEEGDWKVSYLIIKDNAGNYYSLDNIPAFYVKSSSPDLDPPLLGQVIINPDTIMAGSEIEILVNAGDSVAGIEFIQIAITPPTAGSYIIRYGNIAPEGVIVIGEESDGSRNWEIQSKDWYKNSVTIPFESEEGLYEIEYVRLRDSADNSVHIDVSTPLWDSLYVLAQPDCFVIKNVSKNICQGDSYIAEGGEQTVSGTYYDTVFVSGDCDTVIITALNVAVCESVSTLNQDDPVKIYPNPASNNLFIIVPGDISTYNIVIYNMYGQVMSNDVNSTNNEIDISNLPASVYYYEININNEFIQGEFIKLNSD